MMRPPIRSLLWPAACAIVVHGLVGWGLSAHWNASLPGAYTVLAISLVPPAALTTKPETTYPADHTWSPVAPKADVEMPLPNPRASRSMSEREPASAPAVAAATERSALSGAAVSVVARAEHFYSAAELTKLPALAGEPLIDLGDDASAIGGSVVLQLFIDETGRVVSYRVERSDGLPSAVAEKLWRAFAKYRYIPAERDGQAVKSQVTLVIGVQDGQAATATTG